jgi:hypothetical protein
MSGHRRASDERYTDANADALATPSAARPWELPVPLARFAVPAFPSSTLAPWHREFVEALSVATQTPADLPGMLTLGVLAAACARVVEVHVRDGWLEPVNLFVAVALPSGDRKSSTHREAVAPLHSFERSEAARLRAQIVEAARTREVLKERARLLEQRAAKAEAPDREQAAAELAEVGRELDRLVVPSEPVLVCDDATPERVVGLMRENDGCLAIMSPEGDVFDLMAGRYSRNGDSNLGPYLKGHAGDVIAVDRMGRPREFVERPALTLAVAVQPEVLRSIGSRDGFRGRGLLARILFALPTSTKGSRDSAAPPVPAGVRQQYEAAVLRLLRLPRPEGGRHELRFDQPANERMLAFQRQLEPKLGEGGELAFIGDWAGKLSGAVARLSGLLHMADHAREATPWSTPVSAECVERAVALGEYLLEHARAAFGEMGADPGVAAAEHVLSWVKRAGVEKFSKRDVFEGVKGRFRRVAELEPALVLLEEHAFIRRAATEARAGAGRPASPVFEVNREIASHYSQKGASAPGSANSGNTAPHIGGQGRA